MADFHVDYINGSNATGDGSAGNPWGTITHALTESAAGTGDTVKVAGSGLTTVDSTATLSAVDTLTTTTDLTSSISVGDIVKVMPNGVTEFQDWPTVYVQSITATTIQFYEDIYMPGDWRTGTSTYTIKTIDSIYGTTATVEDISNQLGAGADVIGGYNSGFTAIVGLTYLRRTGVGGGSGSGTGWFFRTTNNNINQANFENFHFSQFSRAIDTEYGASYFGDNLHFYSNSSESQGSFGEVYKKSGGPSTCYYSSSDGRVGIGAYQTNFINAGYTPEQNVYQFIGNRNMEFSIGNPIKKFVVWNPGFNSNGAAFGRTANIRSNIQHFSDCDYTTNIIETNRGGFSGVNQNIILFNNCWGNLNSLNFIDGNTTEDWYFQPGDLQGYWKTQKVTMKYPTGFDFTSASILPHLAGARDGSDIGGSVNEVWKDDNGYWVGQQGGTLERVNTTDYDTGNSSREIILCSRMAYAATDPKTLLAQLTKTTASAPTSITIRYKCTSSPDTTFGTRLYFGWRDPGYIANLSTTNINLTCDGTWRDATYTAGSDTAFTTYWDSIAVGSDWTMNFAALYYNEPVRNFLIDSVTVNY